MSGFLVFGRTLTTDGAPVDNLAHYRIEGHPVSVIGIIVTCKVAKIDGRERRR